MKYIFGICLLSLVAFTGCDKAFEQPEDWSSVAVIQASPVAANPNSDTLHVFFDGMRYNSSGILYNTNTTYLPVRTGSKQVDIRRGAENSASSYISSFNYNFEKGAAYSFFVYDTTTAATAQARVLRLRDDLTLPAAGQSKMRVLHLAPRQAAVDVTFVRTSTAPTGSPLLATPDSVTISSKSYVGASPNEGDLSQFVNIPRGSLYTVKVKTAGTQTVLTSGTLNLTQANSVGSSVSEGRIATVYITGTAKGRPLALGAFRHY